MNENGARGGMRLAHLSLFGPDPGQCLGIVNKLERLAQAARADGLALDFHAVLPGGNRPRHHGDYRELRIRHVAGSNPIRVRLEQCRYLDSLLRRYDRVILRYPGYDPVCRLRIRQRNRIILEHHNKEHLQMRQLRDPRWLLERLLGGAWIRGFRAITAVTPEILSYEVRRSRFRGPSAWMPNSIPVDMCPAPDGRLIDGDEAVIRMALVVAREYPWHGALSLIDSLAGKNLDGAAELHVVGTFSEDLQDRMRTAPRVTHHSHLRLDELATFYRRMHVGIGSFELPRGLSQATPLKIREYLAHGLPVVFGYDDPALPDPFPFALRTRHFEAAEVIRFVRSIAAIRRHQIRAAARPHVDSTHNLRRLCAFCCTARDTDRKDGLDPEVRLSRCGRRTSRSSESG